MSDRVDTEAVRVADVLSKFTRCPYFGHTDEQRADHTNPDRRRRIDCSDDQCMNPEHTRYVECDHPAHDAREVLVALRAALAESGDTDGR